MVRNNPSGKSNNLSRESKARSIPLLGDSLLTIITSIIGIIIFVTGIRNIPELRSVELSVENKTDRKLCTIYVNGEAYKERIRINDTDEIGDFKRGNYDLEAEDCDGEFVYSQSNVNLGEDRTWIVRDSSPDEKRVKLSVENKTDRKLCIIYVNGEAYKDRVRIDNIDKIGEFKPGSYDLEAEDCDGEFVYSQSNVNLSEDRIWIVRDSSSRRKTIDFPEELTFPYRWH